MIHINSVVIHARDTLFTKRIAMTEALRREVEIDRLPDKRDRKREIAQER